METKPKTAAHLLTGTGAFVAIGIIGAVNFGGLLLGWSFPVKVATLVVIALVALVTLRP